MDVIRNRPCFRKGRDFSLADLPEDGVNKIKHPGGREISDLQLEQAL